MKISPYFPIALDILMRLVIFNNGKDYKVIKDFVTCSRSSGIDGHPAAIHNTVCLLIKAGLVEISEDTGGIKLLKDPDDISLFSIYDAVAFSNIPKSFKVFTHLAWKYTAVRKIYALFTRRYFEDLDAMETSLEKISLNQITEGIIK